MADEYQKGGDGREIALEARASEAQRLSSPSAARNRDAIRDVFLAHMPHAGTVLEIASGTGEHSAHILAAAPGLAWLPSDPDAASRASVSAWAAHLALDDRLLAPRALDVTAPDWWQDIKHTIDAVICINMIHIAPFEAAEGLFAGAGALLSPGRRLMLYGPFMRKGETAPSNRDFDASLKSRDARWGVRDLDREIVPLAEAAGFHLASVIAMPANNLSVIFEKLDGHSVGRSGSETSEKEGAAS